MSTSYFALSTDGEHKWGVTISIPQSLWDSNGWTLVVRFSDPKFFGTFQLFNAQFANVFTEQSGVEIIIHPKEQKDQSEYYVTFLADKLTSSEKRKNTLNRCDFAAIQFPTHQNLF